MLIVYAFVHAMSKPDQPASPVAEVVGTAAQPLAEDSTADESDPYGHTISRSSRITDLGDSEDGALEHTLGSARGTGPRTGSGVGGVAAEFTGTERYELRRQLGAGGMGAVYEVLDRTNETLVALKTLLYTDPESIYRLKREFRSLTDVRHTNLLRLYDLVSYGERCFFTMELVSGVPFDEFCRPEGALDESRTRSALRQLVMGVRALHAAGIVHRDLKPSNVLVTHQGRVVILDFGLALNPAAKASSDEVGRISGTPTYMAPEQAEGSRATEASDWYAVGAMLYEALSGRPPFRGTVPEILIEKMHAEPPPPSQYGPVPMDLEPLCMALLRRKREERPSSDQLLAQLSIAREAPRQGGGETGPFVGRQGVIESLQRALLDSRQGEPVLVQLHGLSGMGKSTVLERFLANPGKGLDGEVTVLTGRCYERESVPYKAFDDLIDELSRYLLGLSADELSQVLPPGWSALQRVFPVLGRVAGPLEGEAPVEEGADPQELRRQSSAGLKELLRRVAKLAPLVLVIDDAQWGDADSAALASDLLSQPAAPGVVMLLSYRSDEASRSPFLKGIADAAKSARRVEIPLQPLTAADALELARALLGPEAAEAIARTAEGNPFFIRELAMSAASRGSGAPVTDLESVVFERIGGLPDEARRLLEAIAVAARPLHEKVALLAAEVFDREAALDALRVGHFVRAAANTDELYTYHDRIRQTVVRRMDPERRKQWHTRLAQTLEQTGRGSPELMVEHYRGAGNDLKVREYAIPAAEQAARALAFDRAAELYKLAFDLSPDPKPELVRVLVAQMLALAGRCADSAEVYLQGAERASGLARVELQSLAAEQYLRGGHQDKGGEALRPALEAVGLAWSNSNLRVVSGAMLRIGQLKLRGLRYTPRPRAEIPAAERVRLETCWAAALGLSGCEFIRPMYYTPQYLLLSLKAGDAFNAGRGMAMQAVYAGMGGMSPYALWLADQAAAAGGGRRGGGGMGRDLREPPGICTKTRLWTNLSPGLRKTESPCWT